MSIRLKLKSSLLFFELTKTGNSSTTTTKEKESNRKEKKEHKERDNENIFVQPTTLTQRLPTRSLGKFLFLPEFLLISFFFHRPTIISSYDRTHTDDIVWITSITHITNLKQVLSFHHTCKRWLIISWSKVVLSLNREFFCSREQ